MNYEIELSKYADKALQKNIQHESQLLEAVGKFIDWTERKDVNIDVTKLVGDWKGFYRIRLGEIRIILTIDYDRRKIIIDRIAPRGEAY